MKQNLLCLTVLVLLGAAPVRGQEVILQGRVVDAETSAPIMGAFVVAPLVNQGVFTDSLGFFALRLRRSDTYALRITQMGYAQMDIELPPEAESREFTVALPADPVVIEGLVVLTERLADRRRGPYGLATILDQRQLQASPVGDGYQLLRSMLPFADLCDRESEQLCLAGRSMTGGRKTVTVCIDDRAVPGELTQAVLGSVDTRSLYMAEAYTRVGEVRLYTPAYIQRLARDNIDLPPLTFGCVGARIGG